MKYALLTKVSFNMFENNKKKSFELLDTTNIETMLKDKVSFHDFNGTAELLKSIQDQLGKQILDVMTCTYDKDSLTQALYLDTQNVSEHDKIVFIKRKINPNDSYTFCEFKDANDEKYEYLDVTMNDIIEIIKSKYIRKCVILYANGSMKPLEIIDTTIDKNKGRILIKNSDDNISDIEYLNIINILNDLENVQNKEQVLSDYLRSAGTNYLYARKETDLIIINYICQTVGTIKNEPMSTLLTDIFLGDAIIWLESKMQYDERILDLTPELLTKILDVVDKKNFRPKNKIFFNIYRELLFEKQ